MRSGRLALSFIGLLIATSSAAAEQYYFRRYTATEGLSQAVVQALYQDRVGYLWIGTQAGLNRYDGTAFTTYGPAQGLAQDWINAIVEDAHGRLWIATLGGVFIWDGRQFRSYTRTDGLADDRVTALAVDREGGIWCGTYRGISRYDGQRWRTYTTADGLPDPRVNVLLVDARGRLWAGMEAGLAYWTGSRFVAFDPEGLRNQSVRALAVDRAHRLWVGTNKGVRVYERERLTKLYATAHPVVTLCVDRFGIAWAGTPQGLVKIEQERLLTLTARHGLAYTDVRALLEDREGILWIGVLGGLYKFHSRAFTIYRVEDGLGSNVVRPIVRDQRGWLWVGTSGGLSRFDGTRWRNFTRRDGLTDDYVFALLEDRQGWLWIGTRAGVTLFDGARFRRDPVLSRLGLTVALAQDRAGAIWIATLPGGVFKWTEARLEPIRVEGQTFSNARILVDRRGWVWISGDRGLSRWDGRNWRTYTTRDGLASDQPYFLCEDTRGHIWFGYHSSHGVTRFDGKTFQHYTTREGLTNDAVYSLGADRHGNIWIGTARGVDRFDGTTFVHYGVEEGYADPESNAGGFWEDADGTLWFGTMGGLSRYDPRFDLTRGEPPALLIQQVRLGTRSFLLGELQGARPPEVRYWDNTLIARVAVFSFLNERQVQIEYRLMGFQEEWTLLEGRELQVSNLPPGSYVLEVRARKYRGAWSPLQSFAFVIRAPFWQRWWFWGTMGIALLGLFYAGHRWRTAHIRRRAEELEQRVAERTRQLVEKTEELESFIYTVSHDLKAPVISLQGLASLLRTELGEHLSPNAAFYLERIQANAEQMRRLITELLELSRIGRLREPRRPVPMRELVEEVLAELQGQIELKQARVRIADTLPTVVGERTRLRQVWANLISNALRFSRPNVPPEIEIGAREESKGVAAFFVRDNGIGIAPEHREKIFEIFYRVAGKYYGDEGTGVGLAIVKRIIQAHEGRVWVESEGLGKGSTFWFTLPIALESSNATEPALSVERPSEPTSSEQRRSE
ncbi:MAG: ATP-binding protein [Blastocatellia bacterium]|nr:ATP-binding protein [Blastocatellia bacterium]MCX7752902.1 ATP-binding protein [Blastocatellia bacterium]